MEDNIFEKLIDYLNSQDSRVIILHYQEIIAISGKGFKEKIQNPTFFQDYAELASRRFIEEGYYWDNDVKNRIIVFKRIR